MQPPATESELTEFLSNLICGTEHLLRELLIRRNILSNFTHPSPLSLAILTARDEHRVEGMH